ncbi:hypothetical protein POM88_019809 [Heracleum sosnowskyi]|uniref:Ankyrin repeat-containing protein n=1 Tax=Heracleum sosnowskyi TaxID=360622 RepID=A0AAD8IAC3_9APIA|nr:hypothetical protein POM88_019809 [Heracleum sosnowskyi]
MVNYAAERWSSADFEALFSRTDESGSTVLQLAVERNNGDAVELILLEDPAYQQSREIKRNGLMLIIFKAIDNKCSDDIIKLLSQTYQVGISPDHKDVVALILAMKRRDEDSVLGLLRDAKQLVTFTEDNGWTPLHYAGLDTMAKNKSDFTPRDMLYCKNEIVADQVHIKIALDDELKQFSEDSPQIHSAIT